MFFSTISQSKRFGAAVLFVVLLTALGPMESQNAASYANFGSRDAGPAASGAAHAAGHPEPNESLHRDKASAAARAAAAGSPSVQTVRERLSRIKSDKELMEKNKRFPMLHEDVTQFLGSVEVVATGYYAGPESTGKRPGHPEYGITSSGVRVKHGILSTIAADPKVFPMGTILYIPGYGYGIVADTGSAIKGNKIDLFFDTKDQIYKEWGKRTVNVFIVKRGDGRVSEKTLQQWNNIMSVIAEQKDSSLVL